MKSIVLALALVLGPGLAHAQGIPAYLSGTATPNHLLKSAGQGPHMDVGGLTGDPNGRGVSPFAITDNLGPGLCTHSATTGGQHQEFCLGHDSDGNALFSITANGGALEKSAFFSKHGTLYELPFIASGSGVLGPATTAAGYLTTWNNGVGTLLGAPTGAFLNADGLNIAVGLPAFANTAGYAMQVLKRGVAIDPSAASAAIITRNEYSGGDPNANVSGIYGTLWYQGTAGNQGMGIKGNAYTYSSGTLAGAWPNQYITAPNIGTLTYFAGVYGRPAHYLPGTITYAASFFADGIYNISSTAGGAVTNFANLLAIPPYVQANSNYAMLVLGAACSPNCYLSTIKTVADPLALATENNQYINLRPHGTGQVGVYAPLTAGVGQTCASQVQGSSTAGQFLAVGTNCSVQLNSSGTGSVTLRPNALIGFSVESNGATVNYAQISGSPSGSGPTLAAVGADTNISFAFVPKGNGQIIAGSATPGSFGVFYAASNAAVAANFAANKYIVINANGVAHYIPAMVAPW